MDKLIEAELRRRLAEVRSEFEQADHREGSADFAQLDSRRPPLRGEAVEDAAKEGDLGATTPTIAAVFRCRGQQWFALIGSASPEAPALGCGHRARRVPISRPTATCSA